MVVRVDKRFYVPDDSHGPGDYSRKPEEAGAEKEEEGAGAMRITSEEETFDDMSPEQLARSDTEKRAVLDEEKGPSAEKETEHVQAPTAAPNGPASWTPPTPPLNPPAVSHQPQERVIKMSRD